MTQAIFVAKFPIQIKTTNYIIIFSHAYVRKANKKNILLEANRRHTYIHSYIIKKNKLKKKKKTKLKQQP